MGPVKLAIPARPEFVGVVRLAVTSLAREAGLEEERVDDLKIAVSEACTNAMPEISDPGSAEAISILWDASDGNATVEISGSGVLPPTAARYPFSTDLLQTLLDGYEVEDGPDGSTMRLSVALEP